MAHGLDRLTAREERGFTEVGLLDVGKERREGGVVPYGFDGFSARACVEPVAQVVADASPLWVFLEEEAQGVDYDIRSSRHTDPKLERAFGCRSGVGKGGGEVVTELVC